MYIHRAFLLLIGVGFLFYPSLEEWLFQGGRPWYLPFQIWLAVVIGIWWNQPSRGSDEL